MSVKIWLPWKRQVTWAVTCYVKLLPDNFQKKSPSLVAFDLILKKLLTSMQPPVLEQFTSKCFEFQGHCGGTRSSYNELLPMAHETIGGMT